MTDKDIYLVPTTNLIQWGSRVYYFNCHRDRGDYAWFKNNLDEAAGAPVADAIDAEWVFGKKWNPLENL
ncbi:MAG: hypothetical protein ABI594_20180 [Ginsengibacter sp.]